MSEHSFIPYTLPRLSEAEMRDRGEAWRILMAQRRSVRNFAADPVPRELIEIAIATASTAPSGAHRQPWQFVAVSDSVTKRRIREAAEAEERKSYEGGRMPEEWLQALAPFGTTWRKPYLEIAPWLVVVCEQPYTINDQGRPCKNYYVKESVGIACGLFIAALHTMGLATLPHTPSPMKFLSEILVRPPYEKPCVLFPVGYPARDAQVPNQPRKPLAAVATWIEGPASA